MWATRIQPRELWTTAIQGAAKRWASTAQPSTHDWRTTIGVEIHVQLACKQKLFSTASARWDDAANSNVAYVDAGLPGALPRLNPECVRLAACAITGLEGTVQAVSQFDRKHYFYSDQPLGYQITQKDRPIGRGGFIELKESGSKRVRIQQVQLEQDTAKSVHGVVPGFVLTDLNRAGVALLEIVSEADMESSAQASEYVQRMQGLLRHAAVSTCNMEQGSMRCDVNVSVYRAGESRLAGTRCELKNLNSLRTIRNAIDAEAARQIAVLCGGGRVDQETRGFDARSGKTFALRSKETAPDYRYMPEPDVPELRLSREWIAAVARTMPELPDARRARLCAQYALGTGEIETLMAHSGSVEFFERVATGRRDARQVAAWITSDVFGQLARRAQTLAESPLTPAKLAEILDCLDAGHVTSAQARQLLIEAMDGELRTCAELIAARGWRVIDDSQELRAIVEGLIAKHHEEAKEYAGGNKRRLNFFVGKVMAATKGQAKPQEVSRLVKEVIGETTGQ